MLLRRMRDLGRITDASFRRGMFEMGRSRCARTSPSPSVNPEQPERLSRAVDLLSRERRYSVPELASDIGLRAETLKGFVMALDVPARADLAG